DLAVSAGEVVERAYAVVVGAQRDRHFAVAIGLRYAQSRVFLRLAVGDAVHDDVALGAEDVVARDHPIFAERDAEATRQRRCELHLKAMPLPVLASEGQGVGMRAEAERAGILDGGEAPRARRSRGEGDGTSRGERDDASDHANAPSAAGASGASSTLVLLEAADVMNDSLDLLVVESVPEGRHAALLAVLDAGGDEGIAALRAREHGTLAGGTAAILMAKSAGRGEEPLRLFVGHLPFCRRAADRSAQQQRRAASRGDGKEGARERFGHAVSPRCKGGASGPHPLQRFSQAYFSA